MLLGLFLLDDIFKEENMSVEMEKLQIEFAKEKLDALRFYMKEKELTVEGELQKHVDNIYEKHVPSVTRRYLERNDEEREVQTEESAAISPDDSESTERSTPRGRGRGGRRQSTEDQAASGAISPEEAEGTTEQENEQGQGMELSM